MSEPGVHVEVNEQVGTVVIDRPSAMNALDGPAKVALLAGLQQLGADPDVRCVVLTGTGRAFCVGQDLREHVGLLREDDENQLWRTVPDHYNPLALALHEMGKPVVAAVNGVAAGAGASLAFLADYRLVASSAGFNLAFAGIGLSCDTGCSWTLPRLVGPTRALQLLFQPRTIGAAESLELGIATEVVPDESFADRVRAVSQALAQGPTLAFAAMRQAVAFSAAHPLAASLDTEAELMRRTGGSADHRRAVEAFLTKKRPVFTGC